MTFTIGAAIISANPGPALLTFIETELLALGYTLDDTVVMGARTHKVYKSAAAGNVAGKDWWLDIGYPTTGTGSRLTFQCFEGYNPTTHLGLRGPYNANNATIESTYFSRYGTQDYGLETNWAAASGTTDVGNLLQTASFVPYLMVDRDRIGLMMSHTATRLQYCGFFKPTAAHAAHAGAALYPLITVNLNVGGTTSGGISSNNVAATRMPRYSATDFPSSSFTQNGYGWSTLTTPANNAAIMTGGIFAQQNHPCVGETQLQDVPVIFGAYSWPSSTGVIVGYLDGVGFGWASSGLQRGDTTLIDGVNWHALSNVGNYGMFMRGN